MTKDAQAPAAPRRGAASAPAAPGKATFSDDIVAAFREVQASGSALVKDEFESTAQYHARLRSLKGKGETKKYVFIVEKDRDNYTFEYNADAEQMHLTVGTKYLVSDTVQLRSIQTVLGTYVGTNAFGVKKIITRTVEDTYYVSLSSSSPFRLFGKDPYDMFEPAMFTWAMDPAAAKATKEYLRIAVVGTVPSPELATEEKGIRDPTIDDPRQSLICSRTLPFFLEELRVLNPRTGATAASFPPKRDPLADAGPLSDGAGPAGRSRSVPGVDGAEAQGSDPAADLGGVFRVGSGVTAPVPLYMPEPEYSEEARAAKYQGTVVLYAEVDANGRPHNLKVMRSLGLGLDEKAVEAAVKWKFRPGYKNGKPVTVATTIEVNFRLF